MSNLSDLKAKAQAEIAKIEDAAVKEYLTLKTSGVSLKVAGIAVVVAFVLGLVL